MYRLTHRFLALLFLGVLATGLLACSALIEVSTYPLKQIVTFVEESTGEEKPVMTPIELEHQLMRFADGYISAAVAATDRLRTNGQLADPERVLLFKIELTGDVYQVATGPNAYGNLLDMIVLVALERIELERYLIPDRWGQSAEPLLHIIQQNEKAIWAIGKQILKPEMQNELRQSINDWAKKNQKLDTLLDVRSTGFASEIAKYSTYRPEKRDTSVFDLLEIDPLSSLDPATQELTRTRHFAERALYLAQRTPTILRWQAELLSLHAARIPEVETLVQNTSKIGDAAERLSHVAEALPQNAAREREAILKALKEQSGQLAQMATRIEEAFHAGHEMAIATDSSLKTFDQLYKDLKSEPRDPNAKPFDITEYKSIAKDVATTSTQLNQLLTTLDQRGSGADEPSGLLALANELEARGDRLTQKLLFVGLMLIGASCLGLLLTMLLYRLLLKKIANLI